MSSTSRAETLSSVIFTDLTLERGGQDHDKAPSRRFQKWEGSLMAYNEPGINSVDRTEFNVEMSWYEEGNVPTTDDLCNVRGRAAFCGGGVGSGNPILKIFPFKVTS